MKSRLYFFALYNISGIQCGIQCGHAALEYVDKYYFRSEDWMHKDAIMDFVRNHKTFIILNGGTSETMHDRCKELDALGIDHACFHEPDLNGSMTAIAFLVNEPDYAPSDTQIIYKTNPVYEYLRAFKLASN